MRRQATKVVGAALCGIVVAIGSAILADEASPSSPAAIRQYRTAAALQNRQAYDLAINEWNEFLKQFAGDPLATKAQHYLGVCHYQLGRYQEALPYFEKVSAQGKEFDGQDANLLFLGMTWYRLGQAGREGAFATGAPILRKLTADFPKTSQTPQALYYLGETYYATKDLAAAAEAYRELCDRFPEHELATDGLYAWGVALQEKGDPSAADAVFGRFLQEHADHGLAAEVTMRRGEAAYAKGQFDNAAKFFSAAAQRDFPRSDYAQLGWGDALLAQGKLEDALRPYQELIRRQPPSPYMPQAVIGIGLTLYRLERYGEAQKFLEKAVELAGDKSAEAAHWLARCHLKAGEPEPALAAAERGLKANPDAELLGELLMDRADAIYDMPQRRGESVEAYREVVKRAANHPLAPQAAYMAAFTAHSLDDTDLSLRLVAEFLSEFPQHALAADAMLIAVEADLGKRDYAAAEKRLAAMIQGFPGHEKLTSWRLRHALAQFYLRQYESAVDEIAAIVPQLSQASDRAEALYLQGSALLELDRAEEAAASLEQSWAASDSHTQAGQVLLALARAYRQSQRMDDARNTLKRLLAAFPEGPLTERAMYLVGEYAQSVGDLPAAIGAYKVFLEKFPDGEWTPHALLGLASSLADSGQPEEAAAKSSRLLEKFPDHAVAARGRYVRARALIRLDRLDEAEAEIGKLLASKPSGVEEADALYLLGLCQVGRKDYQHAAITFTSLLQKHPDYDAADQVLYELGWAYRESAQTDKATEAFGRIVKAFPESRHIGDSWLLLGEALFERKEYEKALSAFLEARKKPLSDEKFLDVALLHAGQSANALGIWDQALELLEACAQRAGDTIPSEVIFEQGRALQNLKRLDEALERFLRVAESGQGELAARAEFMTGEVLFAKQDHADAIRHYFKAAYGFNFPQWQSQALFEAGRCFEVLKKVEQARKTYQELLETYPDSERAPAARKRLEVLQGG